MIEETTVSQKNLLLITEIDFPVKNSVTGIQYSNIKVHWVYQ